VTIYLINSFTKLIDMAVQVTDIAGTTHRFVTLYTWYTLTSLYLLYGDVWLASVYDL